MSLRLGVIWASIAMLVGVALLVATGVARVPDRAFTLWLQSFASSELDLLADLNTIAGQASVNAALTIVLALYLFWRGPRWAWLAPLALGLVVGVELTGKILLTHPGPPAELTRTSFNPLGVHVTGLSAFPSGHVARVTFLAILCSAIWPHRAVAVLLTALAVVTPFLRIYIGDHWVSDTLGGVAIGVIFGILAVEWLRITARSR